MLKQRKRIFGKEHELTYNSETGLIESEGKFSRPLLNLAIKTSRIFFRRSRGGKSVSVEADTESKSP